MRLANKIALVTGAARGIGAEIARAFVAEGARLIATDILESELRALADPIGADAQILDVRVETDWQRIMGHVQAHYGRLDVLVNNAGITGFEGEPSLEGKPGAHDPEHATLADWHAVLATNLDGVFLGCKYAIPMMRPQGTGAIINLSSRSGIVGIPGACAYAASKAAVRNHSKSVALYCAEQGLAIRCNSIHPAAILTPMWEAMLGTGPEREARLQSFVKDTPLRRFGRPEEVAAIAVMLASDEAAYVTGAEFHVDGGLLAGSAVRPDG